MATATRTSPRSVQSTGLATPRSTLAAVLLSLLPVSFGAAAVTQPPVAPGMVQVAVSVELTCPSCALGLERRLGRLDHVTGVEVQPDDGRIVLTVEPGRRVVLAAVWDTVRNAGFIPDGVAVTAVGHVTSANGAPALALSSDFALPLAPAGAAALEAGAGDGLVQVSGHWNAPPDGSGRLRVESFEVLRTAAP